MYFRWEKQLNINQYFQELRRRFSRETNPVSALDARLLIQFVTGFSNEDFIVRGDSPLTAQQIETIEKFAARRLEGEPVSRILGRREFWGLEFEVTPDTLDPRADTETLVQKTLERTIQTYGPDAAITIADIGTGTGCILISLLTELPNAKGIAVDISPAALAVARRNAARHCVDGRIRFVESSLLDALEPESVEVLVSNPPYIPESDIPNLAKDVRNYDPILALSGGPDGLAPYKILMKEGKKVLRRGGFALYEIGFGQAPDIARIAGDSNATLVSVTDDLGGVPRVVEVAYGDNEKNTCEGD